MGLDIVELFMIVEEHFAIEVDNVEAAKLVNCGMLCDCVVGKLRVRGDTRTEDEIWSQIKPIIVEQFGVKPEEVTREAKFVEDLGGG